MESWSTLSLTWREICRSNTDASLHNSSFESIPLPTQSQFPNIANFSDSGGAG
jgi:hypothetical protein